MIEITTALGVKSFQPGDLIAGRINWSFDESPQEIIVNLIWHTAGRGTEDVEKVAELAFATEARQGEHDFNLQIPLIGPWSYSGNLISIVWLLEVVTSPAIERVEMEIVVGPEAKEVVLRETPK